MRVVKPVDIQIMKIIHRTIERVIKYGPLFEAAIMDRERQNPKFKFLFDNTVNHPFLSLRMDHTTNYSRIYVVTRAYLLSLETLLNHAR